MRIRFDEDINAYQGFFDHQWAKELSLVVEHTRLNDAVFNLCAEWKGISNARRMPWLMMTGLKDAVDSALNSNVPFPMQVIEGLLERLSNQLERHQISLSPADRVALYSEIKEIQSALYQKFKDNPVNGDLGKMWETYLKEPEVQLTVWMSEVSAFQSIYFAYENFLIDATKLAAKKQSLRTKDLSTTLLEFFGKEIEEQCWSNQPIELARLLRHALVHYGRKPTGDLAKYREKLIIEDGQIVIMARHTTRLFNLLKERVLIFANEAVKLSTLQIKNTQ